MNTLHVSSQGAALPVSTPRTRDEQIEIIASGFVARGATRTEAVLAAEEAMRVHEVRKAMADGVPLSKIEERLDEIDNF